MLYEILQVSIVSVIIFFFLKHYNKTHKYLLLGIGFFFLSLLLQLPFHYLQVLILNFLSSPNLIPSIILSSLAIIVGEFTKYFSLKKFLPTKSNNRGKAFVVGWVSFESLNFLTLWFYTSIFTLFQTSFSFKPYILEQQLPLLNFTFFLLINLAISMIVLKAVLKKKIGYLLIAILLATIIPILLTLSSGVSFYILVGVILLYSLSLIYRFWN